MARKLNRYFATQRTKISVNAWDFAAIILGLAFVVVLAWAGSHMSGPYQVGETIPISLDPHVLPDYAVQTVLRMFIALVFSLVFTFVFGAWAAKSKHAERIIIPMIDVLQSIPVLSFLAITVTGFIALFPGSLWGPQFAAIFAIFTAQVWNMTLSFYQSLITLPNDLEEAVDLFQLSAWQRFWRLEVPFAVPGLLWNTMMSMSGSWFFVVESEAITVANREVTLPGIGSYIATAIAHADKMAVVYAISAMLIVIVLYDQLLFRPLVSWSEKFKFEQVSSGQSSSSWLMTLLQRTRLLQLGSGFLETLTDKFINSPLFNRQHRHKIKTSLLASQQLRRILLWLWYVVFAALILGSTYVLLGFIFTDVPLREAVHVMVLGLYTASRVIVLIVLCSVVWIPVGVWIGLQPQVARVVQPILQVLAAFPANLLFPVVVIALVRYQLNVEIWTAPLMILGTQWYILFNVIAGTIALPKDLCQVAANFNVRGWLWWSRLILPGIFPYFITGAITAAGGAWNASIVAEVVSWGDTTLRATGLGAYITEHTMSGDFPRVALGTAIMCLFVLLFNRVIWRPLYRLADDKFQLD